MQRWTALAFSLLFGSAVALLIAEGGRAPTGTKASAAPPEAVVSALPALASASASNRDGNHNNDPSSLPSGQLSALPSAPLHDLPNSLPPDAGMSARFGVIQFPYRGAQFATPNAPEKAEALARARAALEEAQTNFAAAVKRGDASSGADLGEVPRGVLEPAVEAVLFTLPPNTVFAEPIDTPRGYWILRRNR